MDDDLNFTEDEIQEQLEQLGYYNVPRDRLRDFKRGIFFHCSFYPTALKGCRGIVFTHGVWIGGWVGGGKKFVWAVSQKP